MDTADEKDQHFTLTLIFVSVTRLFMHDFSLILLHASSPDLTNCTEKRSHDESYIISPFLLSSLTIQPFQVRQPQIATLIPNRGELSQVSNQYQKRATRAKVR